MSDAICLAPFEPSSLHLRRLLRRNLGLHLPPRRQNHLIPSSLQSRLPLFAVGAPPLALLLFLMDARLNLALKVITRDEIRL